MLLLIPTNANGPRRWLDTDEALTQTTELPMAQATIALSAPLQHRNTPAVVLPFEWEAAVSVWANLPLNSAKQRRAHAQVMALEERLVSLQNGGQHNG